MAKTETFDGVMPVTRRALTRGRFLLTWTRDGHDQAVTLRGDTLTRTLAEQIATGDDPISRGLKATKTITTWGQKAGRKSWAGLTPEERSERARRIALAGWNGKRAAARVQS